MRKLSTLMGRVSWIKGLAGLAAAMAVFCMAAVPSLAAEGKVVAETAKIRAQASTDSEVVGSTVKGKTIDILEAVKDGAGTVWYKVSVTDGGYGYIRGDLVQTSESIEVTATAATSAGTDAPASKPADTVPTSIGEQQAVIKSNSSARIRSGASTQHDTVASLPNGTAITLIGEANDGAGNKWYQMTCTYNNKNIEGYVRSDLIEIGAAAGGEGETSDPAEGQTEMPEGTEGENTEGENPEGAEFSEPDPVPENNDYEVVYAQNDAGEYEYYLYDNINGTRQKLGELLSAVGTANENNQRLQAQVDKEKIIIIILAVVIVILFIVLTVLLFKIRELYYEDYEEEEEEEEPEPEPVPVKKKVKKRVAEEEPEPVQVKKKKPAHGPAGERPRTQEKPAPQKPKAEKELHAAERKEPVKKPAARKPQNFLVDDDEFEFEFLNMDDKDL